MTFFKVIKPTDHKLYAHWRGEENKITLNANGGSVKSEKVTVYYGSKFLYQLPVPTRDNYEFVGWFTEKKAGDKVTAKSIFNENTKRTFYAHWKSKNPKILLIGLNGSFYEKEVPAGEAYGELPEPEKDNHKFGGWYTLADYTKSNADPITEDSIVPDIPQIKLYARWYFDHDGSGD